jgi:hypothetical protein
MEPSHGIILSLWDFGYHGAFSWDHLILHILIHMPIQVCEWANLGSVHIYTSSTYVILKIQSNTLSCAFMFMRIRVYDIQM